MLEFHYRQLNEMAAMHRDAGFREILIGLFRGIDCGYQIVMQWH